VKNDRTTDGRSWLPVVRVAADNTIFDQQKLVRMAWRFQMPRGTRSAQPGSAGGGGAVSSVRVAHKGTFRKEGEYWTVGYSRNPFRLKHSKGLGYLAHFLRHPAVEFHVLDLAGGIAGQRNDTETSQSAHGLPGSNEELKTGGIFIAGLGDAGEMLDEQAKVAYRRRLSELREELEEAKELGKVERAEQAEQEIDALTRELSRGGTGWTQSPGGVRFGTSPREHHQDDQGGGGKDGAE
jgi:hypothetical protein